MKRIIIIVALSFMMAMPAMFASDSYNGEQVSVTDKKPSKKSKKYKDVTFKAHLHCESCVKKVMENISYEKGVKGLDVSLEEQRISIKYDPSKTNEETLAKAIQKLGYEVEKL